MKVFILNIPKKLKEVIFLLLIFAPLYFHYIYQFFINNLDLKTARHLVYSNLFFSFMYVPFIIFNKKKGIYITFFLQSLFSVCEFFYLNLYKAPIGKSTFYIIFETNISEALGYIGIYMNISSLAFYLLILISVLLLIIKIGGNINHKRLNKCFLIFLVLIALPLFNRNNHDTLFNNNSLLKFYNSFKKYKIDHEIQKKLASRTLDEIEDIFIKKPYHSEEIHVLIIGESTNRHHMGLYDYFRNTTPRLAQIKKNLFVFNDVISPDSHTIPALKKALTFANYENEVYFEDKGSLIQFIKKAGYKTFWISNQIPMGTFENLVTVLAKSSDVTLFLNNNDYYRATSFDEVIMTPLNKVINDQHVKKFIVIHLMGLHAPYCKRYTDEFAVYDIPLQGKGDNKSKIINCYDNAVLYNDYIVSEIIKKVKSRKVYSSILYFSDHGEDVYDTGDFRGHTATEMGRTKYMFDIPFILWLSDKFEEFNNEKVAKFQSYLNRKYLNDDVIHTILDLLNIDSYSFDAHRSILSKDFKFKNRLVGKIDYDLDIAQKDNLYEFKKDMFNLQNQNFKQKVWAHRVNSMGKLKEVIGIFNGIELDVMFQPESGVFDITHPPVESIGLNLEKYIGSINKPVRYKLWLDFKNLDKQNAGKALKRLHFITNKFSLVKANIIIEASNPVLLMPFKDSGFYTSYYLPTNILKKVIKKSRKDITDEEMKHIKEILDKFKRSGVHAVSTYARYFDFVKQYIPEANNILLWDTHLEPHKYSDLRKINKILSKDKRIKVLLVKFRSNYDR